MVLHRLHFQAISASPEHLLSTEGSSASVDLVGDSRPYVYPDLDAFLDWVTVGFCERHDSNSLILVPRAFKEPLFHKLVALRHPSSRSVEMPTIESEHAQKRPCVTVLEVVYGLQKVGCTHIRIVVLGPLPALVADMAHPARTDNVWTFRAQVSTRGIPLFRGASTEGQTVPMLGSLSRGFGIFTFALPSRDDGIFQVRLLPNLVERLGGYQADSHPRDSFRPAQELPRIAADACRYWRQSLQRQRVCKLSGASIELSVKAVTLQEARAAVKKSGLMQWGPLLDGQLTGHSVECITVPRERYLAHFAAAIERADRAASLIGEHDVQQAIGILERLQQDIGSVDANRWRPMGVPNYFILILSGRL
ncbi:uncharacterized protein PFL1_01482 [Pseudozyma flocculosa PF-1]|uniref:Uncharacterized protein n=1 Tax=Pseudozyma flocculosa TaxID=84751 RepID=A0A5C3FBN6_9BASI|nr:uncharacterized protein PFL1_01482 [Pseudozyma flocculosa PF-1]EPQ31297.1 hypothetical protein PFL1_01482 [Pseudozyma flocculosa PF-1]SPO41758.1 uncharacterized protein PSFLO_07240 [Pseudozyma flocculosa]